MHRRATDQVGMTLVEMMVAISLLSAIIVAFGPVMTSSFNSVRVTQNESRALDEVRIAVGRIDRELRSAECVDVPAAGTQGDVLRFSTFDGASNSSYEVTYAVDAEGRLTRTVGSSTTYVGEGIVVTDKEFEHVSNAGQRAKVLIDLRVRFEESNAPRRVSTEITGRNAWYGCPP